MELRPGRRLDMSSHFIPLPRSSMIRASSSGDHLLCFFAGDSEVCGGMLRLPLLGAGRDSGPKLTPPPVGCALPGATDAPTPPTLVPPGKSPRGDDALGATAEDAGGGPPVDTVDTADGAGGGMVEDGTCWVGDTEDSFESGPLRSEAISTMTVSRWTLPRKARGS